MYHSRRVRALICARMIPYASVVVYTIFLSESRKMNFRVPYGSRETLNVLNCVTLRFRGLYTGCEKSFCGPRTKKLLRPFGGMGDRPIALFGSTPDKITYILNIFYFITFLCRILKLFSQVSRARLFLFKKVLCFVLIKLKLSEYIIKTELSCSIFNEVFSY